MRAGVVVLLSAMLAGFAVAGVEDTRRSEKTTLEKVLDPLPTYDPFVYSVPGPAYFPDEVDKQARRVLVDALLNRPDNLNAHVAYFTAKDSELAEKRGTQTGLTHHTTALPLWTQVTRKIAMNSCL